MTEVIPWWLIVGSLLVGVVIGAVIGFLIVIAIWLDDASVPPHQAGSAPMYLDRQPRTLEGKVLPTRRLEG